MKKNYVNYKALAMDIVRGQWLIQETRELRKAARNFLDRQAVNFGESSEEGPHAMLCTMKGQSYDADTAQENLPVQENLVLIVPMHGVLTKYDNCIGCATMEVADTLEAFRDREDICGFILDIDSPGGAVNAIMPVVEQIKKIREAGKPIIAHVDQCCSAAYWIASQTDAIFADNIMSSLGSIGAYYSFVDDRENKQTGERVVDIYAPESTEKNRSYREALDGKPELAQKELSETVQKFIAAVKAGRPDIDADAPGVMSGAVFEAAKAVDLGLANAVMGIDSCIENVFVRAN